MSAHESDVVAAFRQTLQDELRRAQSEDLAADVVTVAPSLEEAVRVLSERHEQLRHEVALLRTILLKLVSEPVDREPEAS